MAYAAGGSANVNSSSDVLSISEGGRTYTQQLSGRYSEERFDLAPDPYGGTLVTIACFAAGTRIATPAGEIEIENLRPDDYVSSLFDGTLRVVWLGHRHIDCCCHHRRPADVWPVRIAANAFAPGRPRRVLYLSPDHAVYVDNVLIPVRYLVNGTTIVQTPVDAITYWHLELPVHAVILRRRPARRKLSRHWQPRRIRAQ